MVITSKMDRGVWRAIDRSHRKMHRLVGDELRCAMRADKEWGTGSHVVTYLGSEDGGSSTHKRGSISRKRSEEGGYEEPLKCGGNV
jgi:hypothetical protein